MFEVWRDVLARNEGTSVRTSRTGSSPSTCRLKALIALLAPCDIEGQALAPGPVIPGLTDICNKTGGLKGHIENETYRLDSQLCMCNIHERVEV